MESLPVEDGWADVVISNGVLNLTPHKDAALREILLHNMREEMEHASMVLEWIRRHNSDFAGHLKTYLFTETPITGIEKAAEAAVNSAGPAKGAPSRGAVVTIGSLKGAR